MDVERLEEIRDAAQAEQRQVEARWNRLQGQIDLINDLLTENETEDKSGEVEGDADAD